jgi:predicted component of type VI protein secretion system
MPPRLIVTNEGFEHQSCPLLDGTWKVGRSHDCHLIIKDDSVSAVHCDLLVYGREVIVRECGSRNGTFVDNVRLGGQMGLNHGQFLRVGRIIMQLLIEPRNDDENGATCLTALDCFKKAMRLPPKPAGAAASFPVIFQRTTILSTQAQ